MLYGNSNVFSQIDVSNTDREDGWSFQIGLSTPLADFREEFDDSDDEFGGATYGLAAGLKYNKPVNSAGLDVIAGLNVFYNGLSNDTKDNLENLLEGADHTFFRYFNIPIFGGLQYELPSDNDNVFFANASILANTLITTDWVIKYDGEKQTIEHDIANSFGISLGCGLQLNEKISILVNYYNLGEHDVDYTRIIDNEKYKDDYKIKVNLATLTLVFKI